MRVVFIRHGESLNNENMKKYGSEKYHSIYRQADPGISQKGKEDIILVGQAVKSWQFDHILSSPYKRALETSKYFNESYNNELPIGVMTSVHEYPGIFQKEAYSGLSRQ